jgi:hypothetical protein
MLRRFGVRAAAHVRVEAFAAVLGAEIVEAPLDGATAQLVRAGTRALIVISDRVRDPAARRFSVAHELGHLVLGHPSRNLAELCAPARRLGARDRHEGAARDPEAEANAFAAELLMPSQLLQRRCEVSPVDLAVPLAIAMEFQVSILASAIRFAELTSERCAAVLSKRGTVRWVAPSATLTKEIARGCRVDPSSVAWDFFQCGEIDDRPQPVPVPADAWFETSAEVEIYEHSIASRDLGTVLSMVWVPEAIAPRLGMA